MKVQMLRNANVSASIVYSANGKQSLDIVVNDSFSHTFSPTSKFSKALTSTALADIETRLNHGHYLFVENELVDFRDGGYNGFIHSDDAIEQLNEHIGVIDRNTSNIRTSNWGQHSNSGIVLGKHWSEGLIEVPVFSEGGHFKTNVSFIWNPFAQYINSKIDILRLICSNGMVATTGLINTKIPLVNKWVENLDIASIQIQNKTNSIFSKRMIAMANNRASVSEVNLVANHATKRYSTNVLDEAAKSIVEGIYVASNPIFHLEDVYNAEILNNGVMASQLPSHLTQFDLYNLITELRTHTKPNDLSTQFALDKFANDLVFNETDDLRFVNNKFSTPILSTFSDPDRAFFGNVYEGDLVAA